MAKGEQKSNREAKKPKADKKVVVPPGSVSASAPPSKKAPASKK